MKRRAILVIATGVVALATAGALDAASWKKELLKKVDATYKASSISVWDGALKEGYDRMIVTQPGVWAWPARDTSYPVTAVKDGKFMDRSRGVDVHSGAREFRKGEKVLIFDMKADTEDKVDYLRLSLLSVETTERQEGGNTVGTRYKGALVFWFPEGYLASADFADVKKAINTVIVSENEFKVTDTPPTVRLGMSPEEVERALGRPQKVIDLGSKKIFVYPDVKVTFADGRVADVQ